MIYSHVVTVRFFSGLLSNFEAFRASIHLPNEYSPVLDTFYIETGEDDTGEYYDISFETYEELDDDEQGWLLHQSSVLEVNLNFCINS